MIQTPALIKKLLIHAGVFIFILFNCATVIAQNAEGRYGFIEINSAGIIPLQNFNPNLEEANSTINAGSALTLLGGSAPVTTQINFGQGAGASYGLAATGGLKSMFTYRAELNYSRQLLRVTTNYSNTQTLILQSPALSIKMVYNPFRQTNQHLLLTAGAEIGLNKMDSYTLFSKTDSIATIPFLGTINQITSADFSSATDYITNATIGAIWVNQLWKNWFFSFQCNYILPLQNTFSISSGSTVNNPLFPINAGQSQRDFKISQLRIGLGLMYSLNGKEKR
jgi:hypothetical protein